MIRVNTSSDRRANIQNGFWGWKFVILMGILGGTFFIEKGAFDFVWMIFGLIGGFAVSIGEKFVFLENSYISVYSNSIVSFD